MLWVVPWLEVLGVLAVVFGAGNAIGFALSWVLVRLGRRKRTAVTAKPRPIEAMPSGTIPETDQGLTPAMAYLEPGPVTTGAPPEPASTSEAEPIVLAPPPEPAPKPQQALPAEPILVSVSYNKLAAAPFFAKNPFGTVSITQPDPDQAPISR